MTSTMTISFLMSVKGSHLLCHKPYQRDSMIAGRQLRVASYKTTTIEFKARLPICYQSSPDTVCIQTISLLTI